MVGMGGQDRGGERGEGRDLTVLQVNFRLVSQRATKQPSKQASTSFLLLPSVFFIPSILSSFVDVRCGQEYSED